MDYFLHSTQINCVVKIENPTTEVQAKISGMITGHHLFRLSCNDEENAIYLARQGLARIGVSAQRACKASKKPQRFDRYSNWYSNQKKQPKFSLLINSLRSQFSFPRLNI
ncbi:hypothetical protein DCO47_06170 [Pseudomonas sp. NDM]|nr:hypothetical protein DCO47_06170 [Pseudomonas sp. NDM]